MTNSNVSAKDFIKEKKRSLSIDKRKKIKMKDIGQQGYQFWEIKAATYMTQSNLNEKVFVLERLERVDLEGKHAHGSPKIGDIEYRLGYYIVGKNGKMNGRWAWGQFCPLIPQKDFNKLIALAKKEKTLL